MNKSVSKIKASKTKLTEIGAFIYSIRSLPNLDESLRAVVEPTRYMEFVVVVGFHH